MANEVKIKITAENTAGPAFTQVQTGAEAAGKSAQTLGARVDETGKSFKTLGEHTDGATHKVRDVTEGMDKLDDAGSHATSSLGALGSGFELIGQTGIQTTLESAALATDFLSGVGESTTLVMGQLKESFSGAGGKLKSFVSDMKDGSTRMGSLTRSIGAGVLAVGAFVAATQIASAAFGEKLNPQIGALTKGLDDFSDKTKLSGESARLFGDDAGKLDTALKDVADTGRWSTFARGFAGAIEGATGTGNLFDDSLQHSKERLAGLDDALASLVSKGQGAQAADIFKEVAKRAKEQGVSVAELNAVLPKYAGLAEEAGASTDTMTDATTANTDALTAQDDALHQVADSLRAATDPMFATIDATNDYHDAQDDLNKILKDHKHTSEEVEDAQLALSKATINMTDAMARAGSGTGHLTAEQKRLLSSAGASKSEIARLDRELYNAWKDAHRLDGFNIDITYRQHFKMFGKPYSQAGIDSGQVGGLATGGISGAANGQTSSGLTWVGEHGPELIPLPAGTRVWSAGDSARMAAQASGGGTMNLVVSAAPGASRELLDVIIEHLRFKIDRNGSGSAQNYLGRRGVA